MGLGLVRWVRANWRDLAAAAWVGVLLVAVAVVISRQAGETARTTRAVQAAERKLTAAITADCGFLRDVAELAAVTDQPSAVLRTLVNDARAAYVARGCVAVTGHLTP